MKEYESNQDAFNKVCGDCTGIDMWDVAENDVREMAEQWAANGEPCSPDMVAAAILGLHEYRD